MKSLWIVIFLFTTCTGRISKEKEENIKRMALTSEQVKKMEEMHYGWYMQAVSSLLGAMGKEMYMKMDRNNRKAFVACLDAVENEHEVQKGAQCLVKAFDGVLLKYHPDVVYSPQYDFVGKEMPAEVKFVKRIRFRQDMARVARKHFVHSYVNEIKQELIKNDKHLIDIGSSGTDSTTTSTTVPPSHLNSKKMKAMKRISVRATKKQLRKTSKELKISRIAGKITLKAFPRAGKHRAKRHILSLYQNEEAIREAKRVELADLSYQPKTSDSIPAIKSVVTNMLSEVLRSVRNETKVLPLGESYKKLQMLQKEVVSHNRRGQFKHRMLDMVIGTNHPLRRRKTFSERFREIAPTNIVDKSVFDLVDAVSRRSKDINYNFLSPRFLPLLPDKYVGTGNRPILSPNLFPFYSDDPGNSILPIPEVLEKSGLDENDRNKVLELIMDASGVNSIVDQTLEVIKNLKNAKLDKDIVEITETLETVFKELQNSFTKRQRLDMKRKKYSFMNKEQMEKLYGEKGLFNTTVATLPFDAENYMKMSYKEKEESLRHTVRMMAKGELNPAHRAKRSGYTIQFFRHTTLSPFMFSPTVNTLNVLGPVTLSPSLFSPNILSPLLLSPPVISPQVGNPLIFSPYVVGPNVLSAAVFNAYVFSPYVLSPNVINPYVLSPLILSPFVLCPDVLSPTVLSGVVLSPSVLSPSVLTESALAANVLSPTFLS